jgi:hypothetical protein
MERALELSRGGLLAKAYLAYAYGMVGRTADARQLIAELEERASREFVSPYSVAIAFAGLKDKRATMEWLQKAFAQRASSLAKINVDPIFDFLRSERPFTDLQRGMGLLPRVGTDPLPSDGSALPPLPPPGSAAGSPR